MQQSKNDAQAAAIESKRRLSAHIRTKPQNLNIESFVSLASLFARAGWGCENMLWRKGDRLLPMFEAAETELTAQIAAETECLLAKTVKSYRSRGHLGSQPVALREKTP